MTTHGDQRQASRKLRALGHRIQQSLVSGRDDSGDELQGIGFRCDSCEQEAVLFNGNTTGPLLDGPCPGTRD